MDNLDLFDGELASMVNFTDETASGGMPVLEIKERPKAQEMPKAEPFQEEEPPFEFTPKERDVMDRLAQMAKWVMICGGISMLMWWFETNGMMAIEASYPCTIVCAILAGYGVGTNAHARK